MPNWSKRCNYVETLTWLILKMKLGYTRSGRKTVKLGQPKKKL